MDVDDARPRSEASPTLAIARGVAAALTVVVLGGACGQSAKEAGDAPAVRDSAGIRIVENPAGPRDTIPVGDPVLTIGRVDDPRYQFFRIRDVLALSDGRIVVADRGSHEIRYFSPEGRHLASVGGEGEGPGEFRALAGLQRLAGDTVVAEGARNRRLSFYAPEPEFVRSVEVADRLAPMPDDASACLLGAPMLGGLMEGGTLVLWGRDCIRGEDAEGLRAFTRQIRLWGPGSSEPVELGPFPISWRYERPGQGPRSRFAPVPLSGTTTFEVTLDRIYVASPARYTVRVLDESGTPVVIMRDLTLRRPLDDRIRSAFEDGLSSERLERFATSHYPDSLPAFDGVVVGDERIWALRYPAPSDTARRWSVYGEDGTPMGIVAFPTGFELSAVQGGRAYGVHTDEMGVERIRVFSIPLRGASR